MAALGPPRSRRTRLPATETRDNLRNNACSCAEPATRFSHGYGKYDVIYLALLHLYVGNIVKNILSVKVPLFYPDNLKSQIEYRIREPFSASLNMQRDKRQNSTKIA